MKKIGKNGTIESANNLRPLKIKLNSGDDTGQFAENIIDTVREPLIVLDHDLKVVTASRSFYNFFKVKPDETIGRLIYDLGNGQWNIPKLKELLETILPHKTTFDNYEVEHVFSTIGKRIMLLNARQIERAFGKERIILLAFEDITERKEAEAGLEKTRKELAVIKKSADEVSEFAENIIDTVREPLLALDQELRIVKASRSFYDFFKVTSKETIGTLIYDLGNRQWNIPKLRELLETILPEKATFDNYEVEHDFSKIGKRIMLLNARQIEQALGKEKIILLAIEDITERKLVENSLKESSRETIEYLEILLDHAHAPIIIWDSSLEIKRFNREFEKLSGYNSTEIIGKKIDFLFPEAKIESTLELLQNHISNEYSEVIEIEILTKDKNLKTVLWNSANVLSTDGKNVVATITQDITKRKRMEEALSVSEMGYRRLFESAKDGILVLDAESGKIIDVNPFMIKLFGYSKEIFIEKKIWEIGFFKDIAANKEKFLELQQKEYVRFDNLVLESADGQKINVEFISNTYNVKNHKIIQCNIRDITQRIHAAKRQALTSSILSILNRKNEWTRLVKNILEEIKKFTDFEAAGIRLKEGDNYPYIETIGFPAHLGKMNKYLCPKDSDGKTNCDLNGDPYLECMCGNIISGQTDPSLPFFTIGGSFWSNNTTGLLAAASEKDHQALTRNRCNGGGYESAALIPLHSGNDIIGLLQLSDSRPNKLTIELIQFLEVVGATIGIAFKRMTIEKQIKESEEKFRRITEQITDVIFLVDLSGIIKFTSPASRKVLGYTGEEMTGRSISEFIQESDIPKGMNALAEIISSGTELKNLILKIKKKDGSLIDCEIIRSAMRKDNIIIGALGVMRDISERIKSEEEIVMLARSLKSVNECVYLTDLKKKIIFVNHSLLNTYRYSEDELIGQPMSILRSSNNRPEIVDEILPATFNGGWQGELWDIRKDGTEFPVYLSASTINDKNGKLLGLIGVATDITERKKIEADLSSAAELAKLGYWEYEVDSGNFIFNDRYFRLIHGSSTEKQGGNIMSGKEFARKLVHPDDSKQIAEALQEAISSPDPDYLGKHETRVFREDGEIAYVSVRFRVLKDNSGNTYKVYGVNQDITERKHNELELIKAKEKAEEMDKLKTNFLNNMSHEMRTPLVAILGYTQFLLHDIRETEQTEMLLGIESGGQRLLETINSLLNLSRFVSDKSALQLTDADLFNETEMIINKFKVLAEKKNLYLRLVRKAEDAVSQLDMNSFTKIIENLIVNAIKYTNTGGITIEIDKNILEGVSWCVLKVIDTGIGISKENIELIFEEFRQVSEGLSRKFEGSGLGLTIAKKFVELMGGKITAESEPGIGSTFSIMFKSVVPNSITVEPEIQTAMVNISSYPSQKTKSKPTFYTLLLVEDDKYSKEIAIRYLKDLYKVEFAEKGEVAVRMAADKQYDAVLMDINLGFGLSGLDAANMIRKLKGYEEVPIIAVTAYAMDNDREKFLNNGCTHYISKPYDKESLIGILDEALNNTQVRSGKVISGKTVS